MLLQKFLDFNGGHASGSRRGDGLAVTAVLDVSAGKDARDLVAVVGGEDIAGRLDVAIWVEVHLAGKHLGVGLVADAEEEAADGELGLEAGLDVLKQQAAHIFLLNAEHFLDDGIGAQLDVGVSDGAVEHDLRGAEGLAAMEQGDLGGEAGEEQSFFHGGVAAANDGDVFAAEEEAVAGRAAGDPVADKSLLTGQTEPAGAGTGGDDQRAGVDFAGRGMQPDRVRAKLDPIQVGELEGGAKALRLLLDVVYQFRALDAIRPAGKVFDQGGDRELAAGFMAFEDERVQTGAARVDGRRKPGAARAQNYCVANVCHQKILPVLILDAGGEGRILEGGRGAPRPSPNAKTRPARQDLKVKQGKTELLPRYR